MSVRQEDVMLPLVGEPDEEHPPKRQKGERAISGAIVLSEEEERGLSALKVLLEEEDANASSSSSSSSAEGLMGELLARWLRSFDATFVCRVLYSLARDVPEKMQHFWDAGLCPTTCHLLGRHFENISRHVTSKESENFYDTLFGVADDRQKV